MMAYTRDGRLDVEAVGLIGKEGVFCVGLEGRMSSMCSPGSAAAASAANDSILTVPLSLSCSSAVISCGGGSSAIFDLVFNDGASWQLLYCKFAYERCVLD
jgi:hypothetical protein